MYQHHAKELSLDKDERHHLDYAAVAFEDDGAVDNEIDRMIATMNHILASQAITDRQKDCLTKRYVDGERVNDIAEDMGLTASTVSKHIKKARARLSALMAFSCPRLRDTSARSVTRKLRTRGAGELGELTILGLTTGARK